MGNTQIGPPPDVAAAVPDVQKSTKERVLRGIGGVLSAGSGQDAASSPLMKEMDRQHQIRLATARRHYENATTYGGILGTGEIDPDTNEPTGTDPQTGKPLTPEQRQQYKSMMEGAWGDYEKAAGVSKEAKGTLEKHRGLLNLLVTKGHAAMKAVLGAHQQATDATSGGGGASSPGGGISPPPNPSSTAGGAGGATAAPSGGSASPSASPALTPPPTPPAYNPQSAAQAPALRQQVADARTIRMEQAKNDIEEQKGIAVAEATAKAKLASKPPNVLAAMEPDDRAAFLQSAMPPDLKDDEKSVWNAAVDEATVSGKLAPITKATDTIFKARAKVKADATKATAKLAEFTQTDQYRKWKEKLDVDTKKGIAEMQQSKAPGGMFQTAEFASGGLHALDDAESAMKRLEDKGVMGSLPANKVEDWIFGKGLVDPSLDAETRKDIGTLRSSMSLAGSAMLRAHTGRTSKEIYDDFKNMLGPGQDWSALRGAMDESRGMLTHYAEGASDENIKSMRNGGKITPPPSTGNSPRVIQYDSKGNRVK